MKHSLYRRALSRGLFTDGKYFHVVWCTSVANGWVSVETFLDGDALTDARAEHKGALFTMEEMGVLLGNFGVESLHKVNK